MNLRDYQRECISVIETQPPGAYLCQMATGLGKTVTFANIPRHGRVLLLSHREELVEQPNFNPRSPCGERPDAQEWWGEKLTEQGYFWEVCHGCQSAVRVLEWYMSLNGGESDGSE